MRTSFFHRRAAWILCGLLVLGFCWLSWDSTVGPELHSREILKRSDLPQTVRLASGRTVSEPAVPRSLAGPSLAGIDVTQDPPAKNPRDKIAKDLRDQLDAGATGPIRVIVGTVRENHPDPFGALNELRSWMEDRKQPWIDDLAFMGATIMELTRDEILDLASHDDVRHITPNRTVRSTLGVSVRAVGADQVRDLEPNTELDGSGVTVAVIDSGVDKNHPDFLNQGTTSRVYSVDFHDPTGGAGEDEFGHGTHVAGIACGNGSRSDQEDFPFVGVAPKANILNLRALGPDGSGSLLNVINAIGFCISKKDAYNIRVINLSLGMPVFSHFYEDPLCIATAYAVQAGITVVVSAGNNGSSDDQVLMGGINSPGSAPWVITVGATKTRGTVARDDDDVTTFSSRGPTAYDGLFKPDLVAPGNEIAGPLAQGCHIAENYPELSVPLSDGSDDGYTRLSGTSMATPMVSGTVALMVQANPSLSPNAIKSILLYTAEKMRKPNILAQGNGYLLTEGAVRLALFIRDNSNSVGDGGFWLDATSPEAAVGGLLPYANIGGKKTWFGSAFTYGNGLLWGNSILWGNGILWGDGILWSNGILWGSGAPWLDNLIAYKHKTYGNSIVANNGVEMGYAWSSGILWGNVDLQGLGILWGDGILWTNSILWGLWDPLLIDPSSLDLSVDIGVLVQGEGYMPQGYLFGNNQAGYYPTRPPGL